MNLKNKLLLIITFLMAVFPMGVYADQPSCVVGLARGQKNELTVGDTVVINIGNDVASTNNFIYRYSYNIWFDSETFDVIKENNHYINPINDWDVVSESVSGNNISFVIETNNKSRMVGGKNNISANAIGSIKLKVKSLKSEFISNNSINISLSYPSSFTFYWSDSPYTEPKYDETDTINCDNSSVTLYFKSNVNSLANIKIDNKELSNFNENNTIYNLNVNGNTENINIFAEKKDSKSSISGDIGNKSLKYGINTFKIIVTSESGDKKTYEINVTRVDERSHVNTLKSLKLSSGTINFNSSVNDYNITVKNEVEKITITSELSDSKSKYKEDYRNKTIELNEGMNKVSITVIAEDNGENTYNLNITRELSSNNTLNKITINNKEIKLVKDTFLYNYEVENDITKAIIDVVPSNPKASIEVEDTNLEVGENEINIYVTAPNGDVVSYTLMITRKAKLSSNSLVKSIDISGYSLNFKKDTMYYTLKIKDEEVLDIKVTPEDERSTINIEGNKDLVDGSIIKITVKSEDNTITRYFITIEKGNKGSLTWLIILLIILIIIALIIIFLLRKKEKKFVLNTEEIKKEDVKEEYQIDDNKETNDDEENPEEPNDTDDKKDDDNHNSNPLKRNVLVDATEEK